MIKQETSIGRKWNKRKKEMKISAEARQRQAVWNMKMAHMGNGTDQPPAEDEEKKKSIHMSPTKLDNVSADLMNKIIKS